jgi:hypothetical protein
MPGIVAWHCCPTDSAGIGDLTKDKAGSDFQALPNGRHGARTRDLRRDRVRTQVAGTLAVPAPRVSDRR